MKMRDLKEVLHPEEKVVLYDRFNREIEQSKVEDISEYLLKARVDYMSYSALRGCISIKLVTGRFEL